MRFVLILVLSAFLCAACEPKRSASPVPESAAAEEVSAASEEAPAFALLGGYTPTFPTRFRSQRSEGSGADASHIVVFEYLVIADDQINKLLRNDLENFGFNVRDVSTDNVGMRYLAQNSKLGQMWVTVNHNPAVELSPEAQGTMYVIWREASDL